MAREIADFGQKIGGARKDFYRVALETKDLKDMNNAEKAKLVKRDHIWKREDPVKTVKNGIPREIVYWRNEMRISLPPKPHYYSEEFLERYVDVITDIRDKVLNVTTAQQIDSFYETQIRPFYIESASMYRISVLPCGSGIINQNLVTTAKLGYQKVRKMTGTYGLTEEESKEFLLRQTLVIGEYGKEIQIGKSLGKLCITYKHSGGTTFLYPAKNPEYLDEAFWKPNSFVILDLYSRNILMSNLKSKEKAEAAVEAMIKGIVEKQDSTSEETIKSKAKKRFPIPQIEYISRTGPAVLNKPARGEDFVKDFGIRGGEFGLWMSDADAQGSLDRCYEAFHDLTRVLGIAPETISFNGRLSVGFGSRGHSDAAAHYEPSRQVINLTKFRGQGALCHEWAHAMDDAIGRQYGNTDKTNPLFPFASENLRNKNIPEEFKKLMDQIMYKEIPVNEVERVSKIRKDLENLKEQFFRNIKAFWPKNMTEEDDKEWNRLTEIAWETKKKEDLQELFIFRKSKTKRVIPKTNREYIENIMIRSAYQEKSLHNKSSETELRRVYTDFYKGSKKFDEVFAKHHHGYWQSRVEMFARAFDCYISDKLKEQEERSDYLTFGANGFILELEGIRYAAIPEGEERKKINEAFDNLLLKLKKDGFFCERD